MEDRRLSSGSRQRGQGQRKKRVWTQNQLAVLRAAFAESPYPGIASREQLAEKTGAPELQIHIWFENERQHKRAAERPALASAGDQAAGGGGSAQGCSPPRRWTAITATESRVIY
ncbi:PREDICTED: double homeobox protein 4-like protein 4-like, partial [Elephantulus edwardii]|uniref:double homeobox protein 4-like protein 4-like n=1 Tax=Elephantulus edwardii TaxID=28737 RepID=UPI0003F05B64